MKVLMVFTHPKPNSFSHAVLDSFTRGLRDGEHSFEVLDLYAIGFDTVFNAGDFG